MKHLSFILVVILLLSFVACNTYTHTENNNTFYNIEDYVIDKEYRNFEGVSHDIGIVTKVWDTYIDIKLQDESKTSLSITINEDTKIIIKGNDSSLENITEGNAIHVIWYGDILETDPAVIPDVLKVEVID